jgi:regulation of enolase protein 1 (concanavalin A-like superfamily)
MDLNKFFWINEPVNYSFGENTLTLDTEPGTDFWQRTYYGFQNDNAHACVTQADRPEFTFSVSSRYSPNQLFDQAGVVIYLDRENWFKASVEYETAEISKLGSVVTNLGFSDWATADIKSSQEIQMTYRLSRRNSDFLIESAADGKTFHQMRMFHLAKADGPILVGVYACSPLQSSFKAQFEDFRFWECVWEAYQ